ncbi:MAG: B12-binding domain-containing radical SAM protein [Candidatus Riflebacteria bacterium]|nr:B12-binding domain-containing radical SAM protein [Candidatus Riflebacteria bacterium]
MTGGRGGSAAITLAEMIATAGWLGPVASARRGLARRFLEQHHPEVLRVPKTRKVLLISPTTPLAGGRVYKERRVYTPALSLPLLAALTPPHWDVQICYETVEEIPWDTDAQVVGLSTMGHSLWRAFEIADEFRKRSKHVVLGGTIVSLIPDYCQARCDTVFAGDAESGWATFVGDFEAGRPARRYGVVGERHIDDLPVPRYDLLIDKPAMGPLWPVQVARGCPHRCRFCTVSALAGGCYCPRPVSQIVRDVEALRQLGFSSFFFLDDNIAGDPAFARALFAAVEPLGIRWVSQSTLNILAEDGLLDLAVRSGCLSLCFGLESLVQRSLGEVGKGFCRVTDYDDQLVRIQRAGLFESAEFIIGLDPDTPESIDRLADFIVERSIPIVRAYLFAPIPATPVWHDLKDQGRLLHRRGQRRVPSGPLHTG